MTPHAALRLQLLFVLGCASSDGPELRQTTACMFLEDPDAGCPSADEVNPASLLSGLCGTTVESVVGGPREVPCWQELDGIGDSVEVPACEYDVMVSGPNDCEYGRPFPAQSAAVARADWSRVLRPSLDDGRRSERAAEWTAIGLAEHASVASFARFILELLAHGAPAELLREAQRAMSDELRHAEIAFGLASAYAGRAVGPGPLPVPAQQGSDLCAMATACVREGCVAETRAALLLTERAARESDPVLASLLRGMAEDEGRHAALAWRTVQWAVQVGGEPTRAAVVAALGAASRDEAWRQVIEPVAVAAGWIEA